MKGDNYTFRKREPVCENSYFSIYFDSFDLKGQLAIENYLVIKPKTLGKDNVYGVGILPIHANKVGLLQIYRHPLEQMGWEMPGGFVEPDETNHAAALRELKEESGLVGEKANLINLGVFAPAPSIIGAKIQLFAAIDFRPSVDGPVPEFGQRQFSWFSKNEVERMIDKGDIWDASTLVALYQAHSKY
ncbi:hypothetical protein UR09_00065 [Candidatus Nitromaritima sp. SCGC AAA799-A02]|nr:hypothetical protein UR09_00065 [Candidatus Nitromaritima sp. SCGC AAA799-A02]